jgi:hypothetical protein
MIIVHDGKAHHDDFLAACVLIHKTNQRALRLKATEEHLNDPEYWVVDQGLQFDQALHNFDHHHIDEKICGFTMVLDYFYGKEYRNFYPELKLVEIHDSFGPIEAAKTFNITEGKVNNIFSNPICSAMLSIFSKIEGEINDPMYSIMKDIGKIICENIENHKTYMEIIKNGVQIYSFDDVKIMDVTCCEVTEGFKFENLPTKKYCKDNNIEIDVVLTKDSRNKKGYRMISNNTDKIKFLPNNLASFCHNSGFLISFDYFADYKQILLNHAKIN